MCESHNFAADRARRDVAKMHKPNTQGAVQIRRYDGVAECDVIVTLRDREMVLAVPDYERAVRWARTKAKTYKIVGYSLET